ncbi:MAG TPA: hypothetical protein VKY73_07820 [Polyangiaceae bacterium]|nr:hypothetical protein [Polyangiaceae bacterium]
MSASDEKGVTLMPIETTPIETPIDDPIETTKKRLQRVRRRRRATEQRVLDGKHPVKHHDLLVVPPPPAPGEKPVVDRQELFRVPVVKIGGQVNQGDCDPPGEKGTYVDRPERLDFYDYAQRRTMAIARPNDWSASEHRTAVRGPAFGTLPVKREPAATSCAACYLVNAEALNFVNAWTAEEWNDFLHDVDLPAAAGADDEEFDILLAGPQGKVFYLRVLVGDETPWPADTPISIHRDGTELGSIECLDLRHEMEIWNQLRNGCVAGSALSHGKNKVIPLVNVTSLTPRSERAAPEPPSSGG